MVRLINDKNIVWVTNIVYGILNIQRHLTYLKNINQPKVQPCIYAMWHANQFCVHGFDNKENVNILISNSIDGEIVANVASRWGFQTVRGSSKRKGAVSSALSLIEKLNAGQSAAIMVDGPHGPLHKVKPGAVRLAMDTGLPIIPVTWYSDEKTFIKFPSWDQMAMPFGPCHIANLYGEPIYISKEDDIKLSRKKVRLALEELDRIIPEEFEKLKQQKTKW